jgi:hypothetical protein
LERWTVDLNLQGSERALTLALSQGERGLIGGMLWRYADLKFLYRIQTGPNADLVQSIIDSVFQVDV